MREPTATQENPSCGLASQSPHCTSNVEARTIKSARRFGFRLRRHEPGWLSLEDEITGRDLGFVPTEDDAMLGFIFGLCSANGRCRNEGRVEAGFVTKVLHLFSSRAALKHISADEGARQSMQFLTELGMSLAAVSDGHCVTDPNQPKGGATITTAVFRFYLGVLAGAYAYVERYESLRCPAHAG